MAYKGPDISAWQGNIDIKALASQVDFFIFRCYAGSSKDSKVDRNVNLAIECGKPYGLYIYSYALNIAQAKEEAQRVVNLANSYSIKPAFLCIDMEDADGYKKRCGMPSNQTLKDICTAEGEIFESAGYYAIVYASSSWWNNQLAGLTRFDKWVAHWPVSGGKQKGNSTSPNGENANNCGIWQFTSQGSLNGYKGNLDMNYAYKDFVLNKNGNSNPTPVAPLNPQTTERKIGDVITINGVYTSSDSTKKLKPAKTTGTITKIIVGAKNPYLLDDGNIGWTNDNCIVGNSTKTTNDTSTSTETYIVKKGDCLSAIGSKLGVNWKDIANLNGINNPYVIYAGQILKVPNGNSNNSNNISGYSLGLYVVNTSSGLNVRSGPGTNYGIKTAYKNGTRFDTYEIKNNWARTPSGWVCLDYCKLVKKY